MEYLTLGKTGLKVSRVGLGGIPIQRVDAEAARKLLDAVEAAGINFIDSARGYSVSEELIGQAIEGRRDKFILATKTMSRVIPHNQSNNSNIISRLSMLLKSFIYNNSGTNLSAL